MFSSEKLAVESQIRSFCNEHNLSGCEELSWTPIPFAGEWGISTSFFRMAAQEARALAKQGGKPTPVPKRAQEIAAQVAEMLGKPAGFSHVEAANGYLNLYFSNAEFSSKVVDGVLAAGDRFGSGASNGKLLMVEFSQPNTHKAFHVGHLRSAILGDALSRMLEFAGYDVVRANYPGDMGLHVIKWLWNYEKHHNGERPDKDITQWMGDLYAEANRRLEENPELESEVREVYARWDRREPAIVDLWRETRQWSLDGFDEMYEILDIRFDRYYFNSQMEQPGKKLVDELIERGIAIDERPEGPVIVRIDDLLKLKKEKYRVLVALRSDNTALYSTEDLALVLQKFADYDLDQSIYVVDVRQSLHFQQVFKTLEIAGYTQAARCLHLPYELVNLPGNVVMASREGTVVLLENLIHEAKTRAYQVVQEKNPDLDEEQKQAIAHAVGLGALRFTMLARDNTKTVTFDWETALNFEGQAAPYIQYAHVRANSILRRMAAPLPAPVMPAYVLHPTEIQLIDLISQTPNVVQRAAEEHKPLHLTNHAYELARSFTDFYNQCPVLKADVSLRDFRLRLVAAAKQTIANTLNTLGIEAPEVM